MDEENYNEFKINPLVTPDASYGSIKLVNQLGQIAYTIVIYASERTGVPEVKVITGEDFHQPVGTIYMPYYEGVENVEDDNEGE